jgi:periplasmic divalent cation tolerance protein
MIIVYTTCRDEAEARRIAASLLKERLVACANIFPIRSLYRWRGKLCDEAERAMLLKTQSSLWEAVRRRIKELHSYDLPCIERIAARGSGEFERWVRGETRPARAKTRREGVRRRGGPRRGPGGV